MIILSLKQVVIQQRKNAVKRAGRFFAKPWFLDKNDSSSGKKKLVIYDALFKILVSIHRIETFVYKLNKKAVYRMVMQHTLSDLISHHQEFKVDFEEFIDFCSTNPRVIEPGKNLLAVSE